MSPRPDAASPPPLVVSMAMGYGHLRAAHALADELGTEVLHADRPPLAEGAEQRLWETARHLYEWTSRGSQVPVLGRPLRWILDAVTAIPSLHPRRDLSAPNRPVRLLGRLVDRGLGRGLARRLAAEGRPLLTTYFAPAVAVDDHLRQRPETGDGTGTGGDGGAPPVHCVVTDVDLARAWVGREPAATRVHYLVPSRRAVQRLRAYGVPAGQVEMTGFPLPGELLGGPELPTLKEHLGRRLVRLDPHGVFRDEFHHEIAQFLGPLPEGEGPAALDTAPLHLTFVVGGAGAQTDFAEPLLHSLAGGLRAGRYRLSLVAGTRPDAAETFRRQARGVGLGDLGDGVEVVLEDDVERYFRRFNRLLARTDVLWTKPSELTFFGALGLPLVFTRPVGVQERHNRRWAQSRGAGLRGPAPDQAGERLEEWLADGTLAAAAWNGFLRLPKFGLYQVLERVAGRGR